MGDVMNIFILHLTPHRAANYHTDKHVGNQLKEIAQMLTVYADKHNLLPPIKKDGTPYKVTHPNHPVTRWVCESSVHAGWAARLAACLGYEHVIRFGTMHATDSTIHNWLKQTGVGWCGMPEYFCNSTNEKWQRQDNIVLAYRGYYRDEKISSNSYARRVGGMPLWADDRRFETWR